MEDRVTSLTRALDCGGLGHIAQHRLDILDTEWPAVSARLSTRLYA